MGLIDSILDGRNDANSRRARELASSAKSQQAQGFNLILSRLDRIDARLDRIEQSLGRD